MNSTNEALPEKFLLEELSLDAYRQIKMIDEEINFFKNILSFYHESINIKIRDMRTRKHLLDLLENTRTIVDNTDKLSEILMNKIRNVSKILSDNKIKDAVINLEIIFMLIDSILENLSLIQRSISQTIEFLPPIYPMPPRFHRKSIEEEITLTKLILYSHLNNINNLLLKRRGRENEELKPGYNITIDYTGATLYRTTLPYKIKMPQLLDVYPSEYKGIIENIKREYNENVDKDEYLFKFAYWIIDHKKNLSEACHEIGHIFYDYYLEDNEAFKNIKEKITRIIFGLLMDQMLFPDIEKYKKDEILVYLDKISSHLIIDALNLISIGPAYFLETSYAFTKTLLIRVPKEWELLLDPDEIIFQYWGEFYEILSYIIRLEFLNKLRQILYRKKVKHYINPFEIFDFQTNQNKNLCDILYEGFKNIAINYLVDHVRYIYAIAQHAVVMLEFQNILNEIVDKILNISLKNNGGGNQSVNKEDVVNNYMVSVFAPEIYNYLQNEIRPSEIYLSTGWEDIIIIKQCNNSSCVKDMLNKVILRKTSNLPNFNINSFKLEEIQPIDSISTPAKYEGQTYVITRFRLEVVPEISDVGEKLFLLFPNTKLNNYTERREYDILGEYTKMIILHRINTSVNNETNTINLTVYGYKIEENEGYETNVITSKFKEFTKNFIEKIKKIDEGSLKILAKTGVWHLALNYTWIPVLVRFNERNSKDLETIAEEENMWEDLLIYTATLNLNRVLLFYTIKIKYDGKITPEYKYIITPYRIILGHSIKKNQLILTSKGVTLISEENGNKICFQISVKMDYSNLNSNNPVDYVIDIIKNIINKIRKKECKDIFIEFHKILGVEDIQLCIGKKEDINDLISCALKVQQKFNYILAKTE